MSRIDPRLTAMLDEATVPYTLERGKRHVKLRIDGRLVLTLPATFGTEKGGRQILNARAALKRYLEIRKS